MATSTTTKRAPAPAPTTSTKKRAPAPAGGPRRRRSSKDAEPIEEPPADEDLGLSEEPKRKAKPRRAASVYPPEVLTRSEITALREAFNNRCFTGYRNAAMIALMWRTGARVGELVGARIDDLDLENRTLRLLGKGSQNRGKKPRTVPLDRELAEEIRTWVRDWRPQARPGRRTRWIFVTHRGDKVQAQYVRQMMHRAGKNVEIERRVHPHGLRHTFAVEMVLEGTDLVELQHLLGHSNLATTSRYLVRIGAMSLMSRAIERRPGWRESGKRRHELLDLSPSAAQALLVLVLSRLVDLEQQKFRETFSGEAAGLRELRGKLDAFVNGSTDETR